MLANGRLQVGRNVVPMKKLNIRNMKDAYTIYKRKNGIWYLQSTSNNAKQRSLKTKDEDAARDLLAAENKALSSPALNLELAKVYAKGSDPMLAKRIWQAVMDELASHGKESSQSLQTGYAVT